MVSLVPHLAASGKTTLRIRVSFHPVFSSSGYAWEMEPGRKMIKSGGFFKEFFFSLEKIFKIITEQNGLTKRVCRIQNNEEVSSGWYPSHFSLSQIQ